MAYSYIQAGNAKTASKVSFYARLYYEQINNAASTTLNLYAGMYIASGQSPEFNAFASYKCGSNAAVSGTGPSKGKSGQYFTLAPTHSYTYNRTGSAQTVTVTYYAQKNSDSSSYRSSGSKSFTIPALPNPTVTIDSITRDTENINNVKYKFTVNSSNSLSRTTNVTATINGNPITLDASSFTAASRVYEGTVTGVSASASSFAVTVTDNVYSNLTASASATIPKPVNPSVVINKAERKADNTTVEVIYTVTYGKGDVVTGTCECDGQINRETFITATRKTAVFTNCSESGFSVTVSVVGLSGNVISAPEVLIPPAFYTLDFASKGKSIGIGKKAEDNLENSSDFPTGLLECNMAVNFYGALNTLPIGASYSVYEAETNPNDFLYGTWTLKEKLVSTSRAYGITSLNNAYVGSNSGGSPYTRQEWSVRKNILYLSAGYVCNSWGKGDEYHYATIPIKISGFYRFWTSGASTGGKVADCLGLEVHSDGNIALIMKSNGGTASWNAACMSVDLTHFTWSFDSSKNIDYYTEYVWVRTA